MTSEGDRGGRWDPDSPPVAAGERVRLVVERLVAGGDGLARRAGQVVFVPATAPGDEALVDIDEVHRSYARGHLVEVLRPGPGRVRPRCPLVGECGGCQWQHLDYPTQLAAKTELVAEALRRVGKLDVPVAPCRPAPDPWRYRAKAQLPVAGQGAQLVLGPYRRGTHQVVDAPTCPIQAADNDRVLAAVRRVLTALGVPAYDEASGSGVVRHVLVRSAGPGQVVVVLVTAVDSWSEAPRVARRLRQEAPDLVGVLQNVQPLRTNRVLGPVSRVLVGRSDLTEHLGGLALRAEATSFFQVHPAAADLLFALAVTEADVHPDDVVTDLYCGAGALTLLLAQRAARAVGVEVDDRAVAAARANAVANGIANAVFLAGRVEDTLAALPEPPTVVTLDPPRAGAGAAVMRAVAALGPRRVVYVSCNPVTLARDLAALVATGFAVAHALPVDMFPQTAHVEVVARVDRAP